MAKSAEPPAPNNAVPTNPPIGRPSRCGAEDATDAPRFDTSALLLMKQLSVVWVRSEMVHLA